MTPRPTTLATCSCGGRFEPVLTPRNDDRPAVRFFRCTGCRSEKDHVVETLPELEAA